jgi:hypothetical protein
MKDDNGWIAFEDDLPPLSGVRLVEVASHDVVRATPMTPMAARDSPHSYTHWRWFKYTPPTDLPQRPMPELPDGWEWRQVGDDWRACSMIEDGVTAWISWDRLMTGPRSHSVPVEVVKAVLELHQQGGQ